jgi:YfiH family protein
LDYRTTSRYAAIDKGFIMFEQYLTPNWPAPSNVVALTTLRDTNLETIDLPNQPAWIKQVHGDTVVDAAQLVDTTTEADASISFKPNTVCAIRTADCLPLLLCDQAGTQVAAIHAGWRGLAAGVIAKTCQQLTAPLQQCLVWLGPAIGANAFEVGKDVLDGFMAHGWDQKHLNAAFKAKSGAEQKWLGDLNYLARVTLQQQGVLNSNIYGGEFCTVSDPQRFYSYRRSADAGRMVSLIWIK